MAIFLYSIVVRLYGLVIRISALNKPKAKQWVSGRKNWRNNLQAKMLPYSNNKKVWLHCASYGEFEQGRPLIEAITKQHPEYKIVLSFFSPSGYEAFKNWSGADVIVYLPLDTKKNAADFIEIVNPNIVIFIKYEFWLHFLNQLKNKQIPTYLVSAVFKAKHPFFKWYGNIFKQSLTVFNKLFVQDKGSAQLLKSIGIQNVEITGDTRFDRVLAVKNLPFEDTIIKNFKGNHKLIIAGSTWPKDEELILKAFAKLKDRHVKLIIAPHEIETRFTISTIKKVKEQNLQYALYTQSKDVTEDTNVLILDTIGLLSRIYFYADTAYVGGGFNGGLHNILEPSVYDIPVAFYGQNFENYIEATELLQLNVAQNPSSAKQLKEVFNQQLFDGAYRQMVQEKTKSYFQENGNVSLKVLGSIQFE